MQNTGAMRWSCAASSWTGIVSYTDPDAPTVVNAPSYDTVYAGLWGICRFGEPMPVSLTFTPRGRLGQLVRGASVQNSMDGFEQQFKLTADDDIALKACLTEEKCRKLLALAGTAEGSFSGSLHRDGTLYFAVENNKGLFKGSGSDDVLRGKVRPAAEVVYRCHGCFCTLKQRQIGLFYPHRSHRKVAKSFKKTDFSELKIQKS